MKRPVRKLIALTAATASIINASAMGVNAGYVAEKVGDKGFDSLIEKADRNIYFNGFPESIDGSELVVIGKDGSKSTISLKEGINGVYSYVSTTAGQYNYICPTPSTYGFDFFDPNYRIDPESGTSIVGKGDKFALMNEDGDIISESYDAIYRINGEYFEVVKINGNSRSCGVLNEKGETVLAESEDIAAAFLTADGKNFLIRSENGDYFADLEGNAVTKRYNQIHFWGYDSKENEKYVSKYILENGESSYASVLNYASCDMDFVIHTKGYIFEKENLKYDKRYSPVVFEIKDPKSFEFSRYRVQTADTEYEGDDIIGFILEKYEDRMAEENRVISHFDYYSADGTFSLKDKSFISHTYDRYQSFDYWIAENQDGTEELYDSSYNLKFSGKNIGGTNKDFFVLDDNGISVYDSSFSKIRSLDDDTLESAEVIAVENKYRDYTITTGDYYTLPKDEKYFYAVTTSGKYGIRLYNEDFSEYNDILLPKTEENRTFNDLSPIYYGEDYYSNRNIGIKVSESYTDENGEEIINNVHFDYLLNTDMQCALVNGLDEPVKLGKDYICANNTRDGGFSIYDFNGNFVKDIDCWSLNRVNFIENGQAVPYYVTHDRAHEVFSVYDNNFELVAENIEGDWDGQYYVKYDFDKTKGYNYNDTAYNPDGLKYTLKKFGLFSPEKGVILEPVNDNVVYRTQFADFEVNENTENVRFICVVNDGKTCIYNDNMELVQEWDGAYNFITGTNCAYNTTVTLNSRDIENNTTSTKVYNPFTNEVVYEQSGKYDYVGTFRDGYAMTLIYDAEHMDKLMRSWISGDYGRQGIIKLDGSELVPPMKMDSLNVKSGNYCLNLYGYYNMDGTDSYPDDRDYVYINYFWLPVENIDSAFAESNNLYFAYKSDIGKYIACNENELWGMYSADGEIVTEPEYSFIDRFIDGLALVYKKVDGDVLTGIIGKDGALYYECDDKSKFVINDVYYVTDGFDPETSRPKDAVSFCGKDYYNSFTEKYGYEKAVKCGDLYIVSKGGEIGIVDADENEIVPLKYKEVLYLNNSDVSVKNARRELRDILSSNYSSPFKTLSNGKKLVNLRDEKGKIVPYILTSDGKTPYSKKPVSDMPENVGDFDGDKFVTASDASEVLAVYTKLSTQADYVLSDEEKDLADVNGDYMITAEDASIILAYYSYSSTAKNSVSFREYLENVSVQ